MHRFFVFLAATAAVQALSNCDKLGSLLYEEIGCTARRSRKGCPKSYDCPNYDPPKGACLFKGKVYRDGESINGTAPCNVGCFCDVANYERIICAAIDCFFRPSDDQCYQTHSLDSCCPVGTQCPPFDESATCDVDGKTYKRGQHFRPAGRCLRCVCRKGFKGQLVAPFCRPIQCDVELWNSKQIAEGCAPVYWRASDALCCPANFICPSTARVKNVIASGRKSGDKCKFGSNAFDFNDEIELSYTNDDAAETVNCSCLLPPLLTCKTN